MLTNIDKLVALIECLDYRDIKEQTRYAMSSVTHEYIFHKIVFEHIYLNNVEENRFKLNGVLLETEEGKNIVYSINKVLDKGEEIEKENTIKQAINKLRKVLKI